MEGRRSQRTPVTALVLTAVLVVAAASSSARAAEPARAAAPQAPRPRVDLILIVDTSKSMLGAGKGAANIFPAVTAAAKQIVDWAQPGDNIVFVSYDERVRMNPAVAVVGDREKQFVKQQINALEATGRWTYTTAAIRDAVEEARRLEDAQRSDPGGPHTKLIVLLTDGINDPPPEARSAPISLPEVARQLGDMPWFVWQVQLGKQVDPAVAEAFGKAGGDRYGTIHDPGAKDLVEKIRVAILESLGARLHRSNVRFEPVSVAFGSIASGGRAESRIRLVADPPGPVGSVRLRPASTPAGATVTVTPEQIAIPATGVAEALVVLQLTAAVPRGSTSGTVTAGIADGALEVKSGGFAWSATIDWPTVSFEPANLELGRVRAGAQAVQELRVVAPKGTVGTIRLRPAAATAGIRLRVDPAEIQLGAGEAPTAQVTAEVAADAVAGRQEGQLVAEVVQGGLTLAEPNIHWVVRVPQSLTRLAAEIGGVFALLAAGGFLYWRTNRPKLRGTLRYWKEGSGASTPVDLSSFGVGPVTVGEGAGCQIALQGASGQRARIVPVRRHRIELCVFEPQLGATVRFKGSSLGELALWDRDKFSFAGYQFEYTGDMGPRPVDS